MAPSGGWADASFRGGGYDQFDNRLLFRDNLVALTALEQEFTGNVKCVSLCLALATGVGKTWLMGAFIDNDVRYQPDFVFETDRGKVVCEVRAADEMLAPEVLKKKAAAIQWCEYATGHAREHGGKPWTYLLVPHDAISDNKTIDGLVAAYGASTA